MTSISYSKRELQTTLIQLEADLRKLTATVQALTSYLSRADALTGLPAVLPSDSRPSDVPFCNAGATRNAEFGAPGTSAVSTSTSTAVVAASNARWSLREGGWTLVSPAGQRLALTTLERKFMLALFAANNHSLARNDLSALTAGREPGERPGTSPRGVDVMVSRLRRKAQALGMPLPLRSVRRWGYMFTEEAVTE